MLLPGDTAELPNQRHDGVSGPREALIQAGAVHQAVMCRLGDCLGRRCRNDPEFGLRLRQRGFHIQPGLPAVFQLIQRPNAGVGDAGGGGECVAHDQRTRL